MNKIILAVLFAVAGPAFAAETASFLNVSVGARGLAMGGAYTTLADDASALYWNPAGLAALDKREVSLSHAELAQSARLDFAAFALPTQFGTFAADGTYLSQNAIEGRDALGHPTASFQAADAELGAGFGRKTPFADVGASIKFVQSHIASAQAQTVAFDFGARRTLGGVGPGKLILGAALRNAGPGMKFDSETDSLPLRLAGGAAYTLPGGHALTLELTHAPRVGGLDVGFGGEYQALKGLFVRGGYTTQSAVAGGSSFDAARGLTLGLGWRTERWRVDYAALPTGELGTTHRFTLGTRW